MLLAKHRLGLLKKADEQADRRRAKRPFTRDEFERLLATVPQNRGRVYLFGILTGFRRKEIRTLRWYDVDLEKAVVDLPGRMAKGRGEDVLPLHGQLHEVLLEMYEEQGRPPASHRVFPTMPSDRTWKRDLERAGLTFVDEDGRHLYFHSLRTAFTTMLLRLGNTASQAKRATRHRSTKVLEDHYNHLNVDDTREVIAGLPTFTSPRANGRFASEPLPFVAPAVAQTDPEAASDSVTLRMKATAGRIAAGLIEELSLVYNVRSDAEWLQGAPYVIEDFRRSFDDLELRAISSAG
ncbi:MAG: tyrosine-type recombinase/integrase [Planctomycetota bacterium]